MVRLLGLVVVGGIALSACALPWSGGWRIFSGDAVTAYRDPAAVWEKGRCHLFFTLVETEGDGMVHSYVAESESTDLRMWEYVGRTAAGENVCVVPEQRLVGRGLCGQVHGLRCREGQEVAMNRIIW